MKEPYLIFRPSTHRYKAGKSNGVKSNVLVNPPIITVASGRCTSEPMPVEVAAGTKPTIATTKIESSGRN